MAKPGCSRPSTTCIREPRKTLPDAPRGEKPNRGDRRSHANYFIKMAHEMMAADLGGRAAAFANNGRTGHDWPGVEIGAGLELAGSGRLRREEQAHG
jgi:hypothetical protein